MFWFTTAFDHYRLLKTFNIPLNTYIMVLKSQECPGFFASVSITENNHNGTLVKYYCNILGATYGREH
jgi:hypothetical protein